MAIWVGEVYWNVSEEPWTEIFERTKIPTSFKISIILLSETFSSNARPYTSSEGEKDIATFSEMVLPVK